VCRETGLGILPWSPLASGFLSGKYAKDQAPPPGTRLDKWKDRLERFDNERNWRILSAVREVAAETDATASQVSLAWLLKKPQVTSAIFGARNLAQLEDNVKASDVVLTDAQMQRLDAASAFELGYPYAFMSNVQGRW
jgi:aryl-alcohol dehydrogenase-like predicted oxidoreductase